MAMAPATAMTTNAVRRAESGADLRTGGRLAAPLSAHLRRRAIPVCLGSGHALPTPHSHRDASSGLTRNHTLSVAFSTLAASMPFDPLSGVWSGRWANSIPKNNPTHSRKHGLISAAGQNQVMSKTPAKTAKPNLLRQIETAGSGSFLATVPPMRRKVGTLPDKREHQSTFLPPSKK